MALSRHVHWKKANFFYRVLAQSCVTHVLPDGIWLGKTRFRQLWVGFGPKSWPFNKCDIVTFDVFGQRSDLLRYPLSMLVVPTYLVCFWFSYYLSYPEFMTSTFNLIDLVRLAVCIRTPSKTFCVHQYLWFTLCRNETTVSYMSCCCNYNESCVRHFTGRHDRASLRYCSEIAPQAQAYFCITIVQCPWLTMLSHDCRNCKEHQHHMQWSFFQN